MGRRLFRGHPSSETLAQRTYGCDVASYWRIRGDMPYRGSAVEAFVVQRQRAAQRGIEWALTLPEWWAIWHQSERWALRGCAKGEYVMARLGDTGAYATDNVYICTNTENCRDGIRKAHATMRRRAEAPIASVRSAA